MGGQRSPEFDQQVSTVQVDNLGLMRLPMAEANPATQATQISDKSLVQEQRT